MHGRISSLELSLRLLVLFLFLLFFLFPFYWMIATSLKTQVDAFAIPPKWLFAVTFENYIKVLLDTDFLDQTKNSLIASCITITSAPQSGSMHNASSRSLKACVRTSFPRASAMPIA